MYIPDNTRTPRSTSARTIQRQLLHVVTMHRISEEFSFEASPMIQSPNIWVTTCHSFPGRLVSESKIGESSMDDGLSEPSFRFPGVLKAMSTAGELSSPSKVFPERPFNN